MLRYLKSSQKYLKCTKKNSKSTGQKCASPPTKYLVEKLPPREGRRLCNYLDDPPPAVGEERSRNPPPDQLILLHSRPPAVRVFQILLHSSLSLSPRQTWHPNFWSLECLHCMLENDSISYEKGCINEFCKQNRPEIAEFSFKCAQNEHFLHQIGFLDPKTIIFWALECFQCTLDNNSGAINLEIGFINEICKKNRP